MFLPVQLTITSPPSQVSLEFTFALLFRANALTLRLIIVKRNGSVSLHNISSHHLHHKFVLVLPSHCFSQQTTSRCSYFCREIWQCFSLQLTSTSPPSQVCLEFTFTLLLTIYAFMLRLFSRDKAVFLTTTYLHITSITSFCCVYLSHCMRNKHFRPTSLRNSPSHCHHQRLALRLTKANLRTLFITLAFTH